MFGWNDIAGAVVGKIAFFATYIIAAVFGVVIAVESWLLEMILALNNGIFQSAFVQSGFSISLSIANLAFVAGIIVIAIATILRNESYGIKKLLLKLIVAAILVNFGLVIAAPIFGLGNSFTQYFINCIGPTNGGCSNDTSATGGLKSYDAFATTFAGAFNPQATFANVGDSNAVQGATSKPTSGNSNIAGILSASGTAGSVFGTIIVGLMGMIFTVVNLALLAVVLAALGILLIIRYIYISILAILLPFAWAAWVFPSFSSHWEKWWNQFLRWTFFAPIAFFFIYLSLLLMQSSSQYTQYTDPSSSVVAGSVIAFFGGMFAPTIEAFVREVVFAGLIIGGLIAADKMGIQGAGAMTGTIKDRSKAVGNWAKKQGKKGGSLAWQRAGGQKLTNRLQEGRIGGLGRIPGAKRVASLTGRALSEVQTNKSMVDEATKKVPKGKEEVLTNLKGSMNTQDTLAHLAAAIKGGYLTEDTAVNGKKASDILDNKALLERYGQSGLTADANKLFMSNTDIRNAKRALEKYEAAVKNGMSEEEAQKLRMVQVSAKDGVKDRNGNDVYKNGESVDASALIKDSMDEMVFNMKKEDFGKINAKEVLGKKTSKTEIEIQNVRLGTMASQKPFGLATMVSKLSGSEIRSLETSYPRAIDYMKEEVKKQTEFKGKVNDVLIDKSITEQDKEAQIERIKKDMKVGRERDTRDLKDMQANLDQALKKFETTIKHNADHLAHDAHGAPAPSGAPEPSGDGHGH